MKDSFKNNLKVILCAVVGLLFVLFMFLNKDKINEKNKNLLNKNNSGEVNNKMTDKEKEDVIGDANKFIDTNLSNIYLFFDKSYENINNMDNQDKLWLTYWYLKDDKNLKYLTDYTSDEILSKMQNIFGSKFLINFEDMLSYDSNEVVYKYNKNSKKYEYVGGGTSASSLELVRNEFVNIVKDDNKYLITYKPLFYYVYGFLDLGTIDIVDIKYNKLTTYDFVDYDKEIVISDEEYNKIKDNIANVTYIFERENDNLVLTGIRF